MTYMHKHIVKPGETLFSIAEDYRIAFNTLLQANQLADPNTLYVGQTLVIPGLPDPDQLPYSISVSLLNRTLTLFQHGAEVKTYPIAVGRMLNETPTGDYIIINKAPNPGGPFGAMWMSLSKKHYGIHGTNDPSSIGKAVSKGCIRMFNEDVIELSQTIPIGTKVMIRP